MDMGFETCQQWQADLRKGWTWEERTKQATLPTLVRRVRGIRGRSSAVSQTFPGIPWPRHESSSRTLGALMK
jgi:hypothetical protein